STYNHINKIYFDIDYLKNKSGIEYVEIKEPFFIRASEIKNIKYKNKFFSVDYFIDRPTNINYFSPFSNQLAKHKDKDLLKKCGFDRQIISYTNDKIYLLKNARIAGYDNSTYAIIDGNNNCIPEVSGKYINLIHSNITYTPNTKKEQILCLPFTHAINNYYHYISEVVYGLRYVKMLDENIEILYESDPYGALKYFANRMNIDFDRFKSVQLQLNTIYDYAFIASKPPYMWDKKIYKFFSYFKKNVPSSKSIYISRSNSKNNIRKLVNEKELEKELKLNNIEIIHSENLSLDEQINTFSSAKTIIGPHGAGFTNILFCNDKPRIIELFSDKLIKCDFFMRSQHINAQYTPHICFDNIINIDFVMKSIFEEE
ncbi:MAG: glycosyltransferase family 61 protein, partial [Desulfovibrio sp.]|nr:glycosyltransferase family 61 protein [Desulfovibrio sp.]